MQSGFGSRIRPEEVTPETRRRLVRQFHWRELFALSWVVFPTFCIVFMVMLGYRWQQGQALGEWQAVSPVLVTSAAAVIGIHIWFMRERRFLWKAPATDAVVKEMETSYNLTHTHRLILKYKPLPKNPKGITVNGGEQSHLVTVAIESDLKGFHDDLHEGDSVAIIYDPARPDHVRVVEEEHSLA